MLDRMTAPEVPIVSQRLDSPRDWRETASSKTPPEGNNMAQETKAQNQVATALQTASLLNK